MRIEEFRKTAFQNHIEIKPVEIKNFEELEYYYSLRRPETSDSNLLDLYIWKDCYPTWYYKYKNGIVWISENADGTHYSCIPCRRIRIKSIGIAPMTIIFTMPKS